MKEYTRKCPECGEPIIHKTKYSRNQCNKDKRPCRPCSSRLRYEKYGSHIDIINANVKSGKRKNGFDGKSHSNKSRNLISESHLNNPEPYRTPEFREKMSKLFSGKNNPMYGKNIFNIWVGKYGIEEAKKREKIWKEKLSLKNKGKNNPMYGKESPKNSGKGVSGWYNEFYFRSLHELTFILICERFKIKLVSAEKIRINYISYTGNERTYSPDYIVNDNLLVEIKPLRLQSTPLNLLKFQAATEYCEKNKMIFKIKDFGILPQKQLDLMIETELIKLN